MTSPLEKTYPCSPTCPASGLSVSMIHYAVGRLCPWSQCPSWGGRGNTQVGSWARISALAGLVVRLEKADWTGQAALGSLRFPSLPLPSSVPRWLQDPPGRKTQVTAALWDLPFCDPKCLCSFPRPSAKNPPQPNSNKQKVHLFMHTHRILLCHALNYVFRPLASVLFVNRAPLPGLQTFLPGHTTQPMPSLQPVLGPCHPGLAERCLWGVQGSQSILLLCTTVLS